ncbi:hypothetical protein Ddc_15553 [Ditylenchus destructor]|nr:hypothetical protein Ddc_15553 [Ditylenchus destructor]
MAPGAKKDHALEGKSACLLIDSKETIFLIRILLTNNCRALPEQGFGRTRIHLHFSVLDRILPGYAVWITQLVVRKDMRQKGIATELMCKSWTKNVVAWGLATSNPYGIRALERISQRKCDPEKIRKHANDLVSASGIPAFQNSKLSIESEKSLIHCDFFVNHDNVNKAVAEQQNWTLGQLDEGDEFFAFTFSVENHNG